MKKSILANPKNFTFFLLFSILIFTNAQIVNIPDTNFKNALISIGVDTNNDGEIQLTETLDITSLNLNNKNISDLTGIKSFSNLINLYCGPNNLTTVDLSNMTNLQHAYIGDNHITNINVNGSTNLRNLYCGNNQLSSIDLSGLIYLKYVDLGGNHFSSLQISDLPSLETFSFSNNSIPSTIAFSSLPNIKSLYIGSSNLTSINLNGLQTLKILNCSNNQLNSLSFQDGFLQNLQYLNVEGNPMQFICKDSYDLFPSTDPVPQLSSACVLSTLEVTNKENKIFISPNPAKEYINLSQQVKQIKIFTTDGKLIFDKKENKDSKINISHLPSGVYILTTEIGNSKFIKE
ncbi:leucine-rich repeat domain-containing protein [Chryseobacterium sp. CFBP8996]|uniref:leucine-rich repeat domain-containing protein n=1 Tax=Chryseobacterium sp. CFBP8996 TaxID=3096529 RepID=UPI002A6A8ED7|nr:leucine-rich repeat domain-containing protein [Chryseobacterium sp. CFBP8996]MDY0931034.1 leucine-rich repeat domain-containing protein [Chryseobacterium sp. CFBP8996]